MSQWKILGLVALGALVAFASCGCNTNPSGTPRAKAAIIIAPKKVNPQPEPATEFDPNDAKKSLAWMVAIIKPYRLAPPDNGIVVEEARTAHEEACLKVNGTKIKWKAKVSAVSAEGQIFLGQITDTGEFSKSSISILPFSPDNPGLVQPGFAVNKDDQWVKELRCGHLVEIVGTVVVNQETSPFGVDYYWQRRGVPSNHFNVFLSNYTITPIK